ncbi:hypothetical protein ACIQMV_21165 [Streptomyces sp. NPDC091412]|uniref:hypothetical protein n=1 Tax=Streptomyces sp. NPDC091412 TaxID=3366002 RepID=UPI003825AE06
MFQTTYPPSAQVEVVTSTGPGERFTGDVCLNLIKAPTAPGRLAIGHIAIVVGDGDGDGTAWLEPVTDEQYVAAPAAVDG